MRKSYNLLALSTGAAATLLFGACVARAQQAPAADTTTSNAAALFGRIAGKWSCNGGFPRGGTLAADLTFSPAVDGRVVTFEHVDRAPGAYWQRATWALESKTGRIVSVAVSGSAKDRVAAPAFFVARSWSPTSITLDADTLKAPPFAPNRFTYSLPDANGLKMTWEVNRNGVWALGDSLVCRRA